jgi:hypothetical protein
VNHHPFAVNVAHLQTGHFSSTCPVA